ncbi:MAG: succinate dehydrogenase [Blastocatellia bacterium]
MAAPRAAFEGRNFGATQRRDSWWVESLPVIFLLGGFGIYATLRAFEGAHYLVEPYLSPLYSPLLDTQAWGFPSWFSPALLILGAPLGFRTTCYYYRKAYYRAFFLSPPACAVTSPMAGKYIGERKFPFILQNVHRWFLYLAIIFIVILWYDAIKAFFFDGHFGIGVGSIIMLLNVIFLSLYTFSCHSLRHIVGGKLDCFSCEVAGGPRYKTWRGVSILNEKHMLYAWLSLISVASTDIYITLLSRGVISDFRII